MDCSPPGSSVHGDSADKNTGVGCHSLLQGIFPTQGLNPGFPHWRQIPYRLSHQGSPSTRKQIFKHFPTLSIANYVSDLPGLNSIGQDLCEYPDDVRAFSLNYSSTLVIGFSVYSLILVLLYVEKTEILYSNWLCFPHALTCQCNHHQQKQSSYHISLEYRKDNMINNCHSVIFNYRPRTAFIKHWNSYKFSKFSYFLS